MKNKIKRITVITAFCTIAFSLLCTVNILEAKDMTAGTDFLSERHQKIALIAAFTANGDQAKLKKVLNKGLDSGLTVNEIKEVLIQMYAYTGFPRSLNAINTFMDVVKERKEKGINDKEGEEAKAFNGNDKYETGKANLAKLTSAEAVNTTSPYQTFTPGIDTFLKEHLFADIFERGVLSFQDREVATVSALASLEGVNSQLQSHINIAMNTGLSESQMRKLFSIIGGDIGKKEEKNALSLLDAVMENRKNN